MSEKIKHYEIRSSPDDFYQFFKCHMSDLVTIYPAHIKNVSIISGEDGSVGCVKLWEYVTDNAGDGGTPQSIELVTESINDRERSITYKAQRGNIMGDKGYTMFQFTIVSQQGVAYWTLKYVKGPNSIKDPEDSARFTEEVAKMVDAYLVPH